MDPMKIVVLAGGISTERDVSLSSGAMICGALRARGHNVALVDAFLGLPAAQEDLASLFSVSGVPSARVAEATPSLDDVRAQRADGGRCFFGPHVLQICALADVVFLALHGCPGEDGRIQGAFDLIGIPIPARAFSAAPWHGKRLHPSTLVRAAGILKPDWVRICPAPEMRTERMRSFRCPAWSRRPTVAPQSACLLPCRAALRGA
jgi:D-alanine-D-alanine ligase